MERHSKDRSRVTAPEKGACGCVKCRCGIAVFIRAFHTGLCIAMTSSLLWHDTVLKYALVELQRPVYGACFIGMLGVSLTLYYLAAYTDPGYVFPEQYKKQTESMVISMETDTEQSEEEMEMSVLANQPLDPRNKYKLRYCDYCEIQSPIRSKHCEDCGLCVRRYDHNCPWLENCVGGKEITATSGSLISVSGFIVVMSVFQPPIRSKHCEDCGLCVRRYDHHCPWLENCVGERNHRYFWLFLMVTAVLIIWTFIIIWESFVTKSKWTDWFHANVVLFLNVVVLVLSGPVVLGLFVFHTYLMFSGQSTWEVASRERITYLKYLVDNHNPFDEGCSKNVHRFMCWCRLRSWETMYTQRAKFKDTGVS